MNVDTKLRWQAKSTGDRTALLGPGAEEWSYAELNSKAGSVAAWLAASGVGPGDRVAVLLSNRPAFIPALFGCWRLGAVAVLINTRFGTDELEHIATETTPEAVITADTLTEKADVLIETGNLSMDKRLCLVGDGAYAGDELPAGDPGTVRRMDRAEATVMYTLGKETTPTGVVHTHRTIGAQMEATIRHFGLSAEDTAIVSLPLFHGGGLFACALPPLFAGGSVAVQSSWDATQWAELVETTGATYTLLVPTMMIDVIETSEAHEYDTSSLEYCTYGGAAAEESTLAEFESTFSISRLYNLYGLTETTGLVLTFDHESPRQPGLLGRPSQAVETELVDVQSGEEVQEGEEGELLLRGDIITPRFWKSPDLNEEYFTGNWLHTGDVVRQGADGQFYYISRVDDMIITGGENVAPATVETALEAMPDVAAVAVFGVDHEKWGEMVTAAVVPDEADVQPGDLETFWENEVDLADYQRPRKIVTVDSLPRTDADTIDREALAERVTE